uniref:Protein kinase domain-containing protein n=1 Tax=Ciona savignyi TaxID=51511 RepID=H2YM16_CIOSA
IKLEEILGRGNYGIVHKGRVQERESSRMVAIKTMKDGTHSKERLLEFLTEINFMLNIGNHPNVLSVIGCCTVDKQVLLVTELLKYGDMLGFLHSAREVRTTHVRLPHTHNQDCVCPHSKFRFSSKSLWKMAHHVALGMEFLTKSRIIHGDIAARNILVGEDLVCKISDFGLANDVYRYGLIRGRTERCVPYKWISPERMMSGEVPITSRSDVWSFGNLLYEMVTLGCAPYPGIEQVDLLNKIKEGYRMSRPSSCCTEMYTLMKKCWKFDPWKRPTFHQIVKET